MFQALEKIVDDVKGSAGNAVRMSSLAASIGAALLVSGGFLTAALFVFVQDREGTVAACLVSAAVFFVIAAIATSYFLAQKRKHERLLQEAKRRAAKAAAAAPASMFSDPAMIAVGFQVIRAIGVKRLIPLIAVGGLVAGFLASQRGGAQTKPPAEDTGEE
jgi:membrane associated rhomboid family serine protease